MRIEGTTAIVTGAASGLGRATAEVLAAAGAKVAGLDIAYTDAGPDDDGILRHPCDVTSESSAKTALAAAGAALGPARILVNCAGILESRRVLGRDGVMPRGSRSWTRCPFPSGWAGRASSPNSSVISAKTIC